MKRLLCIILVLMFYTEAIGAQVIDTSSDQWIKTLNQNTYTSDNSAGKRLRQLTDQIICSGMVASSTDNTIALNGDASGTDGAYDPSLIVIISGTGAGQARTIFEYDGGTKTAVIDRNWKTNPDTTSEYIIYANAGRESVNEGLARAGSASAITLNILASSTDNAYNRQLVYIRSGTGEDQVRMITDYIGSTGIAMVQRPWDIIPDGTSGYLIVPYYTHTPAEVQDSIIERWFGISADQSGNDWALDTFNPYVIASGDNTYGAAIKLIGTDDMPAISSKTIYDLRRGFIDAVDHSTLYKFRFIWGSGTVGDAETAKQYSEVLVKFDNTNPTQTAGVPFIIKMQRLVSGTDKLWCKIWNATNLSEIDIFIGIREYDE